MARISEKSVRKIKETVLISDVFEWLGTKVNRKGSRSMAFCPFCEDFNSRTPGCSLNDVNGLFHCFVCGKGGDLITAVREHEECSFVEAVERIAAQFNIPLEYEESNDPEGESRRKKYVEVLEAALEDFHRQMSDEHWREFVENRNLSDNAVETFELGISLLTEARQLVMKLIKQFGEEAVIGSGLCYKRDDGQVILRFRNRAIFPIRTAPGTLIGFGARDLTGKSNQKYLNSPDSELFKKRNVLYGINLARKPMAKNKRVVVCEGYMDTIALQDHGIGEAVGAMGTALTAYNLKYLANFADTIYLSLDADVAGINAAMRTADVIPENFPSSVRVLSMPKVSVNDADELKEKCGDKLYRETLETYNGNIPYPVMVPLAKDPDEFFNERGHSLEEFEENMSSAIDLFLFCAQQQASKVIAEIDDEMDKDEPDMALLARKKQEAYRIVSSFVVGHYNKTNIYQRQGIANWITSAARLVDTFEKMEMEWRRAASIDGMNRYATQQPKDIQPVFSSTSSREEDLLISTLYHHPETRDTIKKNIEDLSSVFTSKVRQSIFEQLNEGLSKNKDVEAISASFSEEEIKELARITMEDGMDAANLSEDTIFTICRTVQHKALENKLNAAMEAPTPDLREIIKLKTQLAALR